MNRCFAGSARIPILVGLLWGIPLLAQELPEDAAMASVLREAAREAAAGVSTPMVMLEIVPDNAPVIVTQVFAEELQRRGVIVRTEPSSGADRLWLNIREMRFSTVTGRNSSYLRTTTAVLGALVSNETEGVHRFSKEFTLSRCDTLTLAPARSERDWLDEGPGFWSSVLEPTLVIFTGVVILVLLFTVRGS